MVKQIQVVRSQTMKVHKAIMHDIVCTSPITISDSERKRVDIMEEEEEVDMGLVLRRLTHFRREKKNELPYIMLR